MKYATLENKVSDKRALKCAVIIVASVIAYELVKDSYSIASEQIGRFADYISKNLTDYIFHGL